MRRSTKTIRNYPCGGATAPPEVDVAAEAPTACWVCVEDCGVWVWAWVTGAVVAPVAACCVAVGGAVVAAAGAGAVVAAAAGAAATVPVGGTAAVVVVGAAAAVWVDGAGAGRGRRQRRARRLPRGQRGRGLGAGDRLRVGRGHPTRGRGGQAAGRGRDVVGAAVGRHDHAELAGGGVDPGARLHARHGGAQVGVLALERRGALHRAADAGVELEHRDLHEDDAHEARGDDRDPQAAADEAVQEAGVGERARAVQGAQDEGVGGGRGRPLAVAPAARQRRGADVRRGRRRAAARAARPDASACGRQQLRLVGSCGCFLFPELAGGAHPGGRRTGVAGDLAGRRGDAPADQLGLGRASADADRKLRRARAAFGTCGEEALHAPIFAAVERNTCKATIGPEDLPGERQRRVDLAELVVDRDPDRLEAALGGMAAGEAGLHGDRVVDDVDELAGRLDLPLLAHAHRSRGRSGRRSARRRTRAAAARSGAPPTC